MWIGTGTRVLGIIGNQLRNDGSPPVLHTDQYFFTISEMVWHEMKDFLRNEWKAHNKEQLVAGIVHFWSTRMIETKCQRYISHLRKVIPRIVELNGAATGMWMDQEMIPVTALQCYIDVLDLLFDINSETTTGNIQNVCVKIWPVFAAINILRPRKNDRYCAGDTLKLIFLNEWKSVILM